MSSSRAVHVLSQYLWPDDAPTGIYAEQLADALGAAGVPVRLVGGRGVYRKGSRAAPVTPISRLDHYTGRRGQLLSTAYEYEAVRRAFDSYILEHVRSGDVVIVTSAPPTTIFLHRSIRRRQALGIYWLQDYYPQLVRTIWDPPRVCRRTLNRLWEWELGSWPHVVKSAGNLGYWGGNARVIRNWNTLPLGSPRSSTARTALYSGNLGHGHDIPSFLRVCETLRNSGYEITVRGDGPGMRRLPEWIHSEPPFVDPVDLIRSYWEAELHLIAGHPRLPDAVFPSKFWNAHATGRDIVTSGFTGLMVEEFDASRNCDFENHLPQWREFVIEQFEACRSAMPC